MWFYRAFLCTYRMGTGWQIALSENHIMWHKYPSTQPPSWASSFSTPAPSGNLSRCQFLWLIQNLVYHVRQLFYSSRCDNCTGTFSVHMGSRRWRKIVIAIIVMSYSIPFFSVLSFTARVRFHLCASCEPLACVDAYTNSTTNEWTFHLLLPLLLMLCCWLGNAWSAGTLHLTQWLYCNHCATTLPVLLYIYEGNLKLFMDQNIVRE